MAIIGLVMIVKALQRWRSDLKEQVIPSKEVTKMWLAFFESLDNVWEWDSNSRDQLGFPSYNPSQAWDFELESLPDRHSSKPVPSPWSCQGLLIILSQLKIIIKVIKITTLLFESLVRESWGRRWDFKGRHICGLCCVVFGWSENVKRGKRKMDERSIES